MRKFLAFGAFAALAALTPTAASADVTVGGFTFPDNGFVDQLTGSSGSYTVVGGTLSQVLTDTNPGTYAFSFDQGAFLDLAFTDNVAVNGAGNDIVLFELGTPDTWVVTINGVTHSYTSAATGEAAGGFALLAIGLNLDDFGIGSGASVSSLHLAFQPGGTVASTSLVGALYGAVAVPEPDTWAMMLLGFAGIGFVVRRKKRESADLLRA